MHDLVEIRHYLIERERRAHDAGDERVRDAEREHEIGQTYAEYQFDEPGRKHEQRRDDV